MKEKTILAQNIQTLRQKKGWTQEVLSSMCKLSAGAIIDYENSRREPCGAALVALEQAFGVTGAQLYGLEPLPHPEDTEPQIQLHETELPHWLGPGQLFHRHGWRQQERRFPQSCYPLLGVWPVYLPRHHCPRSRSHSGDPAELPAL